MCVLEDRMEVRNMVVEVLKVPGGDDSQMKVMGMLVVSLRGANCRFWSHLGCSGQKANICTHTGIAFGKL